jgi:hypothetical protein
LITGSKFQIDSPYDRHWLRLKTGDPLKDEHAVITVSKKGSGEDAAVQFDLPIAVGGRFRKVVLASLVVGVLLAVPQITTVWMNPAFACKSSFWLLGVSAFIAIFNFAAAIAVTLNIAKPA